MLHRLEPKNVQKGKNTPATPPRGILSFEFCFPQKKNKDNYDVTKTYFQIRMNVFA